MLRIESMVLCFAADASVPQLHFPSGPDTAAGVHQLVSSSRQTSSLASPMTEAASAAASSLPTHLAPAAVLTSSPAALPVTSAASAAPAAVAKVPTHAAAAAASPALGPVNNAAVAAASPAAGPLTHAAVATALPAAGTVTHAAAVKAAMPAVALVSELQHDSPVSKSALSLLQQQLLQERYQHQLQLQQQQQQQQYGSLQPSPLTNQEEEERTRADASLPEDPEKQAGQKGGKRRKKGRGKDAAMAHVEEHLQILKHVHIKHASPRFTPKLN